MNSGNKKVSIGKFCQISWGSIITDTYNAYSNLNCDETESVILEDGAWVGFESTIMPGVRLGRMCIIGCRTVINEDVPPYAIVVGNPAKIIRFLNPDDKNPDDIVFAALNNG